MSEAGQKAWRNPDLPVPQGKGTKGPVAQLSPSISPLPRKHLLAPSLMDVTHNHSQESVSSKCSRRWVQDIVSLNGIFLFFVIAFETHFKHGLPVIIMYWQLKITRGIHLKKKQQKGQIVTVGTVGMPTSFHQIHEGTYSGQCGVTAANTLSIAKLRTSNFVSGKQCHLPYLIDTGLNCIHFKVRQDFRVSSLTVVFMKRGIQSSLCKFLTK